MIQGKQCAEMPVNPMQSTKTGVRLVESVHFHSKGSTDKQGTLLFESASNEMSMEACRVPVKHRGTMHEIEGLPCQGFLRQAHQPICAGRAAPPS
jgi:hypothetical protein